MVCCVAVSVFWDMQEDEEVLPEVVSHSRQAGKTVLWEAEVHHLSGRRSRWLDELTRQTFGEGFYRKQFSAESAYKCFLVAPVRIKPIILKQ